MAKSGMFAQNVTLVDLATWLQWPPLQCAMVAMPIQSGTAVNATRVVAVKSFPMPAATQRQQSDAQHPQWHRHCQVLGGRLTGAHAGASG